MMWKEERAALRDLELDAHAEGLLTLAVGPQLVVRSERAVQLRLAEGLLLLEEERAVAETEAQPTERL